MLAITAASSLLGFFTVYDDVLTCPIAFLNNRIFEKSQNSFYLDLVLQTED